MCCNFVSRFMILKDIKILWLIKKIQRLYSCFWRFFIWIVLKRLILPFAIVKCQINQGSKDLGEYKSIEWLLKKKLAISLSFGFCKSGLKCWNLKLAIFLFAIVSWFLFLLEILFTLLTLQCLKCLYEYSQILSCKCHVCGNSFKNKGSMRKQLQQKH